MHLDLLKYKHLIQIRQDVKNTLSVYSMVRKKWLRCTDEEFCRQCLVHFLVEEYGFAYGLMAEEKSVQIQGRKLRFDLVVYRNDRNPYILAEVKSFKHPLAVDTLLQAKHYAQRLPAPYLLITNGAQTMIWQYDPIRPSLVALEDIPSAWISPHQ